MNDLCRDMNISKLHIVYSLIFLIVCASLSGCRKHKDETGVIGFNSDVTKALVSDIQDIKDDTNGISVFGLRVPAGGSGILQFNNRPLTYDSGSATGWSYTGNVEYWIPDNTYYFLALYPYSGADYSYDTAKKGVTFDYVSNYISNPQTGQKDVMYAYHKRKYVTGGDSSPVPLTLLHACASLTFRVRNVSTATVASISNIYLDSLYNHGTCKIDSTITWTPTGEVVDGNGVYHGKTLSNINIDSDTYYEMFDENILVVPQQVRNRPIVLHTTVLPAGAGAVSYTVNAKLMKSALVENWIAGKHYIYTLSITDNRIVFEVKVLDWIDDEITLE